MFVFPGMVGVRLSEVVAISCADSYITFLVRSVDGPTRVVLASDVVATEWFNDFVAALQRDVNLSYGKRGN